ncbi:MAG: hypothetical protein OEM63_03450 [Gammaproteobacteria bacterium]|nr:hypothetical protein [Gammaproteobacteria bacterium]
MKASELNDWLGAVTNIGVIAGLAPVAYEIHQNNIALERQERISQVEVVDGIRAAGQNWEYSIIENEDVADIWMRGNAGEALGPLEEFRFKQLAQEMFRLISQNYRQYSTVSGEPADWVIQQLVNTAESNPQLKKVFIEQFARTKFTQNAFREKVKELDPPELRSPVTED